MAFVSLTRLRVRSVLFLPRFVWLNEQIVRQILKSPGFREGKILVDAHLTFWTLTSWDSEGEMCAYRDEGAHRAATPKLAAWCDEASVARFADRKGLPNWDEAHARMASSGRASKLRNPSPNHAALKIPPVRWRRIERKLAAAAR